MDGLVLDHIPGLSVKVDLALPLHLQAQGKEVEDPRSLSTRKRHSPPRHSRTLSLSSKQKRKKDRKKLPNQSIPGLNRQHGTSTTTIHSRYFSPERHRKSPAPRRRTRSPSPGRSPSWKLSRSRRDRNVRSSRRDHQ